MGVHDDHRRRLREDYEKNGLDSFNNINALELLLFYVIPRKDTNPLAHALLNRFGSLDAVFDAPLEELEAVEGIGHAAALFLHLVPDMARRYELERSLIKDTVTCTSDAADYLIPRFLYEDSERILLLTLDSHNRVLGCHEVGRGVVNGAETNTRIIAQYALADHAAAVILSHNHPGGNPEPSREDLDMTAQIYKAMHMLGIPLLDHVIIGGRGYVSLAERGFLEQCSENG